MIDVWNLKVQRKESRCGGGWNIKQLHPKIVLPKPLQFIAVKQISIKLQVPFRRLIYKKIIDTESHVTQLSLTHLWTI